MKIITIQKVRSVHENKKLHYIILPIILFHIQNVTKKNESLLKIVPRSSNWYKCFWLFTIYHTSLLNILK